MRRFAAAVATVLLVAGCTARTPRATAPEAPPESASSTQAISAAVHLEPELQSTATRFPIVIGTFADQEHGWMVADNTRLLATVDGGQQWQLVARFDDNIRHLNFVSATRGWAFTDAGKALATADGGRTWQPATPESVPWRAEFRDEQFGWDIEQKDGTSPSFVRLTLDGGQTWTTRPTPCKPGFQAQAASFTSPQTGFVLCGYFQGSGGTSRWLYGTTDGGQRWQLVTGTIYSQRLPDFPPGIRVQPHEATPAGALPPDYGGVTLDFLDATHGVLSLRQGPVNGHTYTTADGGKTWTQLPVPAGDLTGQARFFTPRFGRILVNNERQWAWLETGDGGATWHQLFPPLAPLLADSPALQFFDADHGVAAGTLVDPGAILATADGGRTWRSLARIDGEWIHALSFADRRHGWASAAAHLYRTQDGGVTWTQVSGLTWAPSAYRTFVLADDHTGYSGDWNGPLLVSHDGGATFTALGSDPPESPQFRFADARTGWLAREHKLLATDDGGATWHRLSLQADVVSFDLRPGGDGWVIVVGDAPKLEPSLLATRDGGRTWKHVQVPGIAPSTVTAADGTHAWLTDSDGHLYRTADAGQTWEQVL